MISEIILNVVISASKKQSQDYQVNNQTRTLFETVIAFLFHYLFIYFIYLFLFTSIKNF